MSDYSVTIAPGAVVVYHGVDSPEAASVTNVDADRELIECRDVPGVLRIQDVLAVGVYGDEAMFQLDGDGTDSDRITLADE